MSFYVRLTARCRMLHQELEGLTALEKILDCPEIIARRKAELHELIEHNLSVQSVDWPDCYAFRKHRVYSPLMNDLIANPDMTIANIGKRHGLNTTYVSQRLTAEMNLPPSKKRYE